MMISLLEVLVLLQQAGYYPRNYDTNNGVAVVAVPRCLTRSPVIGGGGDEFRWIWLEN